MCCKSLLVYCQLMNERIEWISDYPDHGEDEWNRCREQGDFTLIMYDWYRWVGNFCTVVAFIQPNSPDFREIQKLNYYLLSGSLARCSHLIFAIMRLTHQGGFADAAQILHRSLSETAVKIRWLCQVDTDERITRLVADGLSSEIIFQEEIRANIADNAGVISSIEKRMLRSISDSFDAAGIGKKEVDSINKSFKKIDMREIMTNDLSEPSLQYIIQQRLGSHAVHGTWQNIKDEYLSASTIHNYRFQPKGSSENFHLNYYMSGSNNVLKAIYAYADYVLKNPCRKHFCGLADEGRKFMMDDYSQTIRMTDIEGS